MAVVADPGAKLGRVLAYGSEVALIYCPLMLGVVARARAYMSGPCTRVFGQISSLLRLRRCIDRGRWIGAWALDDHVFATMPGGSSHLAAVHLLSSAPVTCLSVHLGLAYSVYVDVCAFVRSGTLIRMNLGQY